MDPKELLLRHFEKAVFAIFLAFFGFIGSGVLSKPKELDQNEKLGGTIDKIGDYMRTFKPTIPPPKDTTVELRKQCDPAEVPAAEAFPSWLAHRRPNFVFTVASGPQKRYPKHENPIDFRITETGRGRVKLAWKTSPENEFITIKGYTLYRKDGETAEFKQLKDVGGDVTEYEDTSVASRQKYWYRLVEHAETDTNHPFIVQDKTDLPNDKKSLPALEDTKPVETPQDIYVTMDSGTPADPIAEPPKKGEASLKVWRWHQASGKFIVKGYIRVFEGEKIGKPNEKISIDKKTETIDFSTDAVLVEIRLEKRKIRGNERDIAIAKIHWNAWNLDEDIVALKEEWPKEIQEQLAKEKGGGK